MNRRTPAVIQSLDRGLTLLEQVCVPDRGAVKLGALARVSGLDPSSAFRIMHTLRCHGLVRTAPDGKGFLPGRQLIRLAAAAAQAEADWIPLAGPVLRDLTRDTGENAHLAVRAGTECVLVANEPCTEPLAVRHAVGDILELHSTAVGKCLLAAEAPAARRALLETLDLRRHTPRTLTSIRRLAAECDRVARQGYAVDREERHEGIRCVAVPVRHAEGGAAGALGISGPTARMGRKWDALTARVRQAGETLGRLLDAPATHLKG